MKSHGISWESLDWAVLDRLRDRFLSSQPGGESYWTSADDLANYDFTYAQRIGWKWDALLDELKRLGWTPPPGPLLDWGCGSGVAGRRVRDGFGANSFERLVVMDHSSLAMRFAAGAARVAFPELCVEEASSATTASGSVGVLVLSHVLNELTEGGRRALRQAIDRADAVLWVEPGTFADSRGLIAMRESLREQFTIIAPCTHQAPCGLGAAGNERHWCHHFASPPAGIMGDGDWVRFAQRAGIDLRSLPYSFLVLERRGLRQPLPGLVPEGCSRVIGEPRLYKGYAKVLSCQADGVRDLMLQKRDAPEFFKEIKAGRSTTLHRWEIEEERIVKVSQAGGS